MWFRRLFLCLGLILPTLLLGLIPADGANPDAYRLERVISHFTFSGVEVRVVWESCGQVNAFYLPKERKVILCTELHGRLTPGQIRFLLAHELGHAVIHQRGIPVVGYSDEIAADMLASYVLYFGGMAGDILDASRFFLDLGNPEDPTDPHPGDVRRGLYLACLGRGEAGGFWCGAMFLRNKLAWDALLKATEPDAP